MKSQKWLLFLTLFVVEGVWCAQNNRYPNRQIDRPLILPKNMWQETLGWVKVIGLDGTNTGEEWGTTNGFLPNLPSWSITDNLEWTAIPLPNFRYLLTKNNIKDSSTIAIKNLSITLDGGITSLGYTSEEFDFSSFLGMQFKKPLLNQVWSEGYLAIGSSDLEKFDLLSGFSLGLQLTRRIHSISRYSFFQAIEKKYRPFHSFNQCFGINFHSGLSLNLNAMFMMGSETSFFAPGAYLSFQW